MNRDKDIVLEQIGLKEWMRINIERQLITRGQTEASYRVRPHNNSWQFVGIMSIVSIVEQGHAWTITGVTIIHGLLLEIDRRAKGLRVFLAEID